MLRATHLSKDEMISSLEMQGQASTKTEVQSITFSCNLPVDNSTHPYNRNGAIAYAHQFATAPNPAYYYFPDNDCTNFVNQAIHEGSQAELVFGGIHDFGSLGWYYYSASDYSNSWTHVQSLYDFITQYWVWPRPGIDDPEGPGGPEGCETDEYNALPGDLVQFEWFEDENHDGIDDDTLWDHNVIIVLRGSGGSGYKYWVSGHSDDIDSYPLDDIEYQDRRFIRIERIDGYAKVYLPLVLNAPSGYLQNIVTNPYPAPMEINEPSLFFPYPAP